MTRKYLTDLDKRREKRVLHYYWMADNILAEARFHKVSCNREDCSVQLLALGKAYEHFVQRKLTADEWREFV